MFIAKIAAALVVSAALVPGVAVIVAADADAQSYSDMEELYLEALHEEGIGSYDGDDALLRAGYAICHQLRSGATELRVVSNLLDGNPDIADSGTAGYIVGAAQAAFCDETHDDGIGW